MELLYVDDLVLKAEFCWRITKVIPNRKVKPKIKRSQNKPAKTKVNLSGKKRESIYCQLGAS